MSENMMKGRTLFEEVWESRFPRRQTVEEELLDLQVLAPNMIEDLHALFKEAVTDSIANILGGNEARALTRLVAETGFENPRLFFEALDSVLHGGSRIFKDAIVEEFRVNVHLLMEKVKRKTVRHGPTISTGRPHAFQRR
jgi:hypothetical protein